MIPYKSMIKTNGSIKFVMAEPASNKPLTKEELKKLQKKQPGSSPFSPFKRKA